MRVLVSCGGTGGHLYPALSFIDSLSKNAKNLEIALLVTNRNTQEISGIKYKTFIVSLVPVRNITAIWKLIKGTFQSIGVLFRFRPSIVIGFGGYASFPVVFFASIFGFRAVLHEQNVTLGTANRVLCPFVRKIYVSFPKTREHLSRYKKKVVLTGNPLRPDLAKVDRNDALRFFNLASDKFTLLVMGGSQGSRKINNAVFQAISLMKDKTKFQAIHLCGKADYALLKQQYSILGIEVRVFDFFRDMKYAYCAADLIICRAGAITVSELIFFEKPAIIIPYPYARAHQIENALVLQEKAGCIIMEDKDLDAGMLLDNIELLAQERDKLQAMSANIGDLQIPHAADKLAQEVLNFCS